MTKKKAIAAQTITNEVNMFKVRCVRDLIVVKPRPAESTSAGGIIIPDIAKEKPSIGTVVNHGPGIYDNGVLVAPEAVTGNEIIYGKWAGTPVTVDGEDYLIMSQPDVLAII